MRLILLGAGSIGGRHLQNALTLGHEVVAVVDPDPKRLSAVRQVTSAPLLSEELSEAWGREADAALVCSPTIYHVPHARWAVRQGLHVLIEKPLSHTLEGVDTLLAEATAAKRVVLVACNLRFLPSLQLMHRLLQDGRIGRPLTVRANAGYYLPSWRPGADYRNSYSAQEAAGGGALLDWIHEFDYLRWWFGEVQEVFCYAGRTGALDVDVDEYADVLLRFRSGVVGNVHVDYVQRTYRRSCEVIGTDGVLVWDYIAQMVSWHGTTDHQMEVFSEHIETERNQMFLAELRHFVACLEGREQPALDLVGARALLQVVLAAKRSSLEDRPVPVTGAVLKAEAVNAGMGAREPR